MCAARTAGANLLLHPAVGMGKANDIEYYTRVRCYEHVLKHYPEDTTTLSLLPVATRMAGPREALWHPIIEKNYGCTHFIVTPRYADPGKAAATGGFNPSCAAQELAARDIVYVPYKACFVQDTELEPEDVTATLPDAELRRHLQEGRDLPKWFTYPEVAEELRKSHPPLHRQGFTVFFTGLPCAGKSTLANALMIKLMQVGGRPVTLLDGDIVRKHLSSELGFSREHRDLNILRIGFVASEITKNGGVAICAPIAPYRNTRRLIREMIEPEEFTNYADTESRRARMPKLNREQLLGWPMPLPKIEIQRRIVAQLNEQMSSAERLVKALEAQLEAIQALPVIILRRAFSGEL
jgi:ATP sulfurylase (sulfate adenylyltransferase)